MKLNKARIIIADVYDKVARAVMCEAYKLNMTAKDGYVWFLPLWLNTTWYNSTHFNLFAKENISCNVDEMKKVTKTKHTREQ